MKVFHSTTPKIFLASWVSLNPANASDTNVTALYSRSSEPDRDILQPLRLRIDNIPPMCKLNPLYEEVVGLRFRALCYLADDCGEDISQYC
jgi:hypothetical protein